MNWKIDVEFSRPFTLLPPFLGMLSGAIAAWCTQGSASAEFTPGLALRLVAAGSVASILNAASNGLNQIYDVESDKIDKPRRPLPSGRMSPAHAWVFTCFCYFSAMALAFAIDETCGWIVALGAMFTVVYSAPPFRSKRHWLAAAVTIAVPRGLMLKLAGWSVMGDIWDPEPWYLGGIFGLFLLGATATKDFSDMAGDRHENCITLPLRFGIPTSLRIIAPFLILPFLLFPLGAHCGILSGNFFWICALGISLCAWGIHTVRLLFANPHTLSQSENHPAWRQMYFMMMYAQIGVAVAYLARA